MRLVFLSTLQFSVTRQRLSWRRRATQVWVIWVASRQGRIVAFVATGGGLDERIDVGAPEGNEERTDDTFHEGRIGVYCPG